MASQSSLYALRLCEDTLPDGGASSLPALNRVLYVRHGDVVVASAGREARIGKDQAWHGADSCEAAAEGGGATLLRYELVSAAVAVGGSTATEILLEHSIDLDPGAKYLMRADRVDFAPGGVALSHRHRGGGIRCLIAGALDVTVGDEPARRMTPGCAWFESGREAVRAVASKDEPASFIRVSILPRAIRGQTSIMYVDPTDAERGRPRRYTVYVDEPIEIA